MLISCKKIDNPPEKTEPKELVTTNNNYSSRGGGSTYAWTNENLLKLVYYGTGGFVQVDTTCVTCPADSLQLVEFPTYSPPVNSGGMVSFPSMNDYNLFIKAANLMEDLWRYTDADYEDTPQEIFHLGEESLNALDSALGFQSLRHKYNLNEFYNHDWIDTASLYVEDDDYQIVLNTDNEVSIGGKFYKHISNNIIATINNANVQALEKVRFFGVFANSSDVVFYNEDLSDYENPPKLDTVSKVEGCSNFEIYAFTTNLTPLTSTANQWTIQLHFSVFYNQGLFFPDHVLGDYTINWGDGTIETFRDRFILPARRNHVYSQVIAPGNSVQKQITVTCSVVNPDASVLFYCPTISSILFTANTFATLTTPVAQGECMRKNIIRKFNGQQQTVNGKEYRINCKLKQKSNPAFGGSHVTATATFEKKKNGKWKNTRPINTMYLNLKGNIYTENTCSNLYGTLNLSKSTTKKEKLKIREGRVSNQFESRKSLPFAINADYIWKYNNNQSVIGNYNEILKP